MATPIGDAYVRIRPDTSGFQASLKNVAKLAAGAFTIKGGVDLFKGAINSASDLNEQMSKSQAVFGAATGSVRQFAKDSAKGLGQSQRQALEAVGTYGNLFTSMGIGQEKSAQLSIKMTTLASDLASFNNASPKEALDALRAGLTGETEPLKRFGININEATLKAEALASGIVKPVKDQGKVSAAYQKVQLAAERLAEVTKKHGSASREARTAQLALTASNNALEKATAGSVPQLTAQQKALAGSNLIMRQSKNAQGDFARTSGGLANQQRILAAELDNFKATLGSAFLPVVIRVVGEIRKFIDELSKLGPQAREVASIAQGFAARVQALVSALGGLRVVVVTAVAAYVTYKVALAAMTVGTKLWAAASFLAKANQQQLNAAMRANIIGIVVIAVTALVAALVLLYQRSETARRVMDAAFAGIRAAADAALGFITRTIIPALITAFNAIAPIVTRVFGVIAGVIRSVVGTIQAIWKRWGDEFTAIAKFAFSIVQTYVMTYLKVAFDIARGIIALFQGDWGKAWDFFKSAALEGVKGVSTIMGKVVNAIKTAVPRIVQAMYDAGYKGAVALAKGIASAPGRALGAVSDSLGFTGGGGDSEFWAKIKTMEAQKGGESAGAFHDAFSKTMQVAQRIQLQQVTNYLSFLANTFMTFFRNISDATPEPGKKKKGKAVAATPISFVADLNPITTAAAGVKPKVEKILKDISNAAKVAFLSGLKDLPSNLAQKMKDTLEAQKAVIDENRAALSAAFGRLAGDAFAKFDANTAAGLKKIQDSAGDLAAAVVNIGKVAIPAGTKFRDAFRIVDEQAKAAGESIEKNLTDAIKGIDDALNATLRGIEASGAALTPAEAELKRIRDARDEAARSGAISDAEAKLNAAKLAGGPEEIKAAQKAFDDAQFSQREFDLEQAAAAERLARDKDTADRLAAAQAAAEALRVAAQKAAEDKRITAAADAEAARVALQADLDAQQAIRIADYESKRALDRRNLEDFVATQQTAIDKNTKNWRAMGRKVVKDLNDKFAPKLKEGAINLGKSFDTGFAEGTKNITDLAGKIAAVLKPYLAGKSPPPKGPLSDMDTWWEPFGKTLIGGFDERALTRDLDAKLRGADLGRVVAGVTVNPAASRTASVDVPIDDAAILARLTEIVEAVKGRPTVGTVTVNADDPNQLLNQLALLART